MFIVDRIEGNIAVVEFGDTYLDIPLSYFKEDISEGDVLYLTVDKNETEHRKMSTESRLNRLFNKSKNWGGFWDEI